ncbi:MAG: LPS assembly lipoprotein LptE, partial [Syntrophales bacterium]|nr:LPS assembly lipoprotein LptE [Syntrophales bacterium]
MAARLAAAVLCLSLFFTVTGGCGYRFAGGGEHISGGIKNVYVETLENRTAEANIENIFRAAFVEWFIKGNRFRIVASPGEADAVWRGSITNLVSSPLSYGMVNLAQEEKLTVTLHLRFYERETGRVIWEDRNFSGSQDYPITSLQDTDTRKRNALSKL